MTGKCNICGESPPGRSYRRTSKRLANLNIIWLNSYLNFNTKEIASLLNISLDSCKKKRQRLASKLGIDTTQLHNYLLSIVWFYIDLCFNLLTFNKLNVLTFIEKVSLFILVLSLFMWVFLLAFFYFLVYICFIVFIGKCEK